jgi:hypothetical protein
MSIHYADASGGKWYFWRLEDGAVQLLYVADGAHFADVRNGAEFWDHVTAHITLSSGAWSEINASLQPLDNETVVLLQGVALTAVKEYLDDTDLPETPEDISVDGKQE